MPFQKNKTTPLVSVVIPVYNGELYIKNALESVFNQTHKNVEIWVIDNGPIDATESIVKGFPFVNYVKLTISNVANARNTGVSLAKGEYIAFLDQDDLWVPDKLEKQLHLFHEKPECSGVISLQKMYLEKGCNKPTWLKQEFLESPQFGYLPSALMVRKDDFYKIGEFETNLKIASDTEWFFLAKDKGFSIEVIHEALVFRKIHNKNHSHQVQGMKQELLSLIKQSVIRKRAKQ